MPMLGAAELFLAIGTSAAIGSIIPDPITPARVAGPMTAEEQMPDISLATSHSFNGDRGSTAQTASHNQPRRLVGQTSITPRAHQRLAR
jgi:hypothetical protein